MVNVYVYEITARSALEFGEGTVNSFLHYFKSSERRKRSCVANGLEEKMAMLERGKGPEDVQSTAVIYRVDLLENIHDHDKWIR